MLGKFAELILFGFAPMMLGAIFMPGAYAAEETTISGEVAYRERIALPPNAVLTVRLTDVSLADAPGAVVAEQTIEPAGQVPIKFELRYDPAVVQPKMNYALQARITVDDKLWFITDERYLVDPLKREPTKMLLKMVRQDATAPSIKIGKAGATMMACPEALMDQERKFFAALERAAVFRIDNQGKLFLVDADGAEIARFAAG